MKTRIQRWLAVALASATVLACSEKAAQLSGPQFAGTPSVITIFAGNSQLAAANATLPTQVQVKITDASGTPVARANLTFSVLSGGGTLTLADTKTNNSGIAVATWKLGASGVQQVKATLSATASVTFTATIVKIEIVSGNNQTGNASTTLAAQPTIKVTDEANTPVAGVPVTWSITAGGGCCAAGASTAALSGQSSVSWFLGASGAQTLQAAIAGASVSFNATVIPGGSHLFVVSGNNQAGTPLAQLSQPLVVQLKDGANNVIPGALVSWSVEAGANLGSVQAALDTTDAGGAASNGWTLGWAKYAQTLKAKVAGVDSIFLNATLDTANLRFTIVSGSNQTANPGATLPNQLVVQFKTLGGTPIAGVTGTFAVASGGGSVTKTAFTTGADGRDSTSWTVGASGTQNVTANIPAVGTLTFNASLLLPPPSCCPPPAGSHVTIVSGNNQKGTPLGALPAPVIVELRDPNNTVIPGATVNWAGNGNLASASSTTDVNGRATNTWTLGWTQYQQTLRASVTGADSTFFTATIDTAKLRLTALSGNNQSALAGTLLPNKLIIEFKDTLGNVIPNATGTFAVTSGGGTISKTAILTGANGRDSVAWTLGASGAQAVTANIGGETLTFNASFGLPAGSHLVIVQGDNQKSTVADSLPTNPVVKVLDGSNNVVPGATVTWSVVSGGGGIRTTSTGTDVNGTALNRWKLGWSSVAQTMRAKLTTLDSLTFTASIDTAKLRFNKISGDAQSGPAGGLLTNKLIIEVKDSLGVAIPGAVGTFAVTAGGGTLSKSSFAAGANGRDSVAWTLGASGAQTMTANIPALGARGILTFSATVAGLPAGSHLVLLSGNNQKSTVADTMPTNLVVEVRDGSNVLVPNATVSWSVVSGGGALRTASTVTDGTGQGVNRWKLGWSAVAQQVRAKLGSTDSLFFAASVDTAKLRFTIVSGNTQSGAASAALAAPLVVQMKDSLGVNIPGATGTFAVTAGGGTLGTAAINTNASGQASSTWTLGASGTQTVTATTLKGALSFTATITSSPPPPPPSASLCPTATTSYQLDMTVGQSIRKLANDAAVPLCLNFDNTRDHNRQYLVLFEDVAVNGDYTHGYFSGTNDSNIFGFTISTTAPSPFSLSSPLAVLEPPAPQAEAQVIGPDGAIAAWEGPTGTLYEYKPVVVPESQMIEGTVQASAASQMIVTYNVGDVLTVFMSGITRLGIADGNQTVVVKKVTAHVVFAEDTRLGGALVRENGTSHNTPLTDAQMTEIANEFDNYGAKQDSMLFNGSVNAATANAGGKVVLVHTLMGSNSVWGYTLANTNVVFFDYWVGTTDGATPTSNQNSHRVADNLITHETAHERHYGLNSTSFASSGGNGIAWVEGFARFTERGAVAARLLANQNYSRTGNATLGKDAALGGTSFVNDVPDFTKMPTSAFTGYDAFGYYFDYFADQYSAAGGDWRAGIRTLLLNGNNLTNLNTQVGSMLPGENFFALLTDSRVALYADDYTTGLPNSLQYLQYNLRASRSSSLFDPRSTSVSPKITPGLTYTNSVSLGAGASKGYLIDGVAATTNAAINITRQALARGVISITRIK